MCNVLHGDFLAHPTWLPTLATLPHSFIWEKWICVHQFVHKKEYTP